MYLLHTVIHRQQRLQSLALQHVGELHMNGLHGAGVAHNPVFVWIRGVVITGRSEWRRKESQSVDLLKHDWGKSREFSERLETLFVDSVLLMLEESTQTDFDSWDVSAWMCEGATVSVCAFAWSELQMTAIDCVLSLPSLRKWHIAILQSHGFSGVDWQTDILWM